MQGILEANLIWELPLLISGDDLSDPRFVHDLKPKRSLIGKPLIEFVDQSCLEFG